jgi:hypothetical protein
MADMSQASVSLAEHGYATPATLERLARALGDGGDPQTLLHVVAYEERRTAAAPASETLVVL